MSRNITTDEEEGGEGGRSRRVKTWVWRGLVVVVDLLGESEVKLLVEF